MTKRRTVLSGSTQRTNDKPPITGVNQSFPPSLPPLKCPTRAKGEEVQICRERQKASGPGIFPRCFCSRASANAQRSVPSGPASGKLHAYHWHRVVGVGGFFTVIG